MNIKRLWITIGIVFTIIFTVILVCVFSNYQKQKDIARDKTAATQTAKDFSLAWFNYSSQGEISYLNKIKPYMTVEFYEATKYTNTERPQDFEGQPAMVSSILSGEISTYESSVATIDTALKSKEVGSKEKEINIEVNLVKINDHWLVESFQ
jgi:hypothetical protein